MSPTRSSKTSSRPVPYGHFTRYSTASPSSTRTTVPSITYTELVNYFDAANDQLYDLLDGDGELHRIIYAIETLQASNRTLKELQERQEQYMLDQFELALQKGLHGRLSPMVVQQRRAINRSTPPPHEMDGSDSRNNRSIQPLNDDDREDRLLPRSLLERMSLPKFYIDDPDPTPSSSTSSFSCDICTSFRQTIIDHNTPDCRHYICFVCEATQPGHFPENCPDRPTTTVPTDLID